MAKINDTTTYPNTTPVLTDHLPGTDVSDTGNDANGETVTFTLQAIMDLYEANFQAPADFIDAITEIASALKTGSDTTLVTGTAGTDGNIVAWDANGDAVDGSVVAANILVDGDIGVSVQGYDADTLKADTADTLTVGFDSSDYAAGTKSSGTYTPAASNGNFQVATNGGAHTLAPPTTSSCIVIHYTNNGSAGAITTSGFTAVTGDSFTTTDTHEFVCHITKINDVSVLHVTALQ